MDKAYYAVPGETGQFFCIPRHAPQGAVLMDTSRPNPTDICKDNSDGTGTWVVDELAIWEAEIAETDTALPRYLEDLYDANPGLNRGVWTEERYQAKKEIRGRKPQ